MPQFRSSSGVVFEFDSLDLSRVSIQISASDERIKLPPDGLRKVFDRIAREENVLQASFGGLSEFAPTESLREFATYWLQELAVSGPSEKATQFRKRLENLAQSIENLSKDVDNAEVTRLVRIFKELKPLLSRADFEYLGQYTEPKVDQLVAEANWYSASTLKIGILQVVRRALR